MTISKKTAIPMDGTVYYYFVTPFGVIGLKLDSGVEFKVNGQRLKHYRREEIPKADTMKLSE